MQIKPYQIQYCNILVDLLTYPDKEVKTRVGNARSRFSEKMKVDLRQEFPLMDIKQTSFKNIFVELLWFLKGDTNIKYLVDNKCNIWTDDAFRWYNEKYVPLGAPTVSKEDFLTNVKNGKVIYLDETIEDGKVCFDQIEHDAHPLWFRQATTKYIYGDLNIIYGRQWRSFGGKVDQLKDVIATLKKNPDDRRMIITAHNPADIAEGNVGLPSCHNYMQFYSQPMELRRRVEYAAERGLINPELQELVDKYIYYKEDLGTLKITNIMLNDIAVRLDAVNIPQRYLSVLVNIRSNDFFLGNPYNIASYALLVSMIAQCVNMIPYVVSCEMVDCHLYEEHFDAASEWIERFRVRVKTAHDTVHEEMISTAKLIINPEIKNIDDFTLQDCRIENYSSLGKIDAPLLT